MRLMTLIYRIYSLYSINNGVVDLQGNSVYYTEAWNGTTHYAAQKWHKVKVVLLMQISNLDYLQRLIT